MEPYRVPVPKDAPAAARDIWVTPPERTEQLFGISLSEFEDIWNQLLAYRTLHKGDPIDPCTPQWIAGDQESLQMVRQHDTPLKRTKLFGQVGNPISIGFLDYLYALKQKQVLPAKCDIADCPPLLRLHKAYDAFCQSLGVKPANDIIATFYVDGDDCITYHSDDEHTIAPSDAEGLSLITILKTGETARSFDIKLKLMSDKDTSKMSENEKKAHKAALDVMQKNLKPFFSKVVPPWSVITMTVEANNATLHAVLAMIKAVCGSSGSVAWRTVLNRISAADLVKMLVKSDKDESSASQNPFEVAARKARDVAKVRVGIALAGKAGVEVGIRAAEVEVKAVEAAAAANAVLAEITKTAIEAVDRAIAAGTEESGAVTAAAEVEIAKATVTAASARREAVKLCPAARCKAAMLAKAEKLAAAAAELAAAEMELAVALAIVQEFAGRSAPKRSSKRGRGPAAAPPGTELRSTRKRTAADMLEPVLTADPVDVGVVAEQPQPPLDADPVDVGAVAEQLQQALAADPVDEGAVEQALTALGRDDVTEATLIATGARRDLTPSPAPMSPSAAPAPDCIPQSPLH